MRLNKKIIYNLPNELKLYIVSFIPVKSCLYCHILVSSFDSNIYCSNYCFVAHHVIIVQRITHILFFYFIFQFKLLFVLSINTTIVLFYLFCVYSLLNIIYTVFYCNSLFQNDCCSIY